VTTFYNVSSIWCLSWTVFTVKLGFLISFLTFALLFHNSSIILVQVSDVYWHQCDFIFVYFKFVEKNTKAKHRRHICNCWSVNIFFILKIHFVPNISQRQIKFHVPTFSVVRLRHKIDLNKRPDRLWNSLSFLLNWYWKVFSLETKRRMGEVDPHCCLVSRLELWLLYIFCIWPYDRSQWGLSLCDS